MPNSNSKLSLSINDQYFTPVDTAKWCFEQVHEQTGWEFKGTALEPAVGAFAFVDAAEQLGLDLKWTTNDLFPQPGRKPDFQQDFKKFDFGVYNYIITNPPFGSANSLARGFMKKSLTMAPRVVMLLPKGARRLGFQDAMPRNARRVLDASLDDETFVTSTGEVKIVKTCVQAWETTKQTFPKIRDSLDLRTDLMEWWGAQDEHWNDGMDLQVVRWGNVGAMVPTERHRRSGSLMSVRLKGITSDDFVHVQEALDFSDFREMCSGAPAFDVPIWVHRFNTEAVKQGLLAPVDKVSQ
jgi:hypothetical protein